jgi:hypothetical protein
MPNLVLSLLVCLVLLAPVGHAAGYGFDLGVLPEKYEIGLQAAHMDGTSGTWVRVRGLAGSGGEGDGTHRSMEADRKAMRDLRLKQVRICVILRWRPSDWKKEGGTLAGYRLPSDLIKAYARGLWLGEHYGDLVDSWEIDNEPDIGFIPDNPEKYAAFLKAVYLGLHAGIVQVERREERCDRLISDNLELRAISCHAREVSGSQFTAHGSQLMAHHPVLAW